MPYFIAAAALVALDQLVKFLIRTNLDLYECVPFIPHVMDLTYVQNTGAAFSILEGHTWPLTLVSAVISAALAVVLAKKWVVTHPAGRWPLAVILAGAVGNLIDRAFLGFVTDMFRTTFIDFAVFNVADICVVLGGIAFCIYYVLFYEKLEGTAQPQDPAATPSQEDVPHTDH